MKRLETCWAQEHGSMIGAQMCILHFCMCFLVEILWLQIEIPVHYLLLGPRYLKMLQEKRLSSLKMSYASQTVHRKCIYLWKRHFWDGYPEQSKERKQAELGRYIKWFLFQHRYLEVPEPRAHFQGTAGRGGTQSPTSCHHCTGSAKEG